jgi:formylglycine-generating enzyme required for sulfatase activity
VSAADLPPELAQHPRYRILKELGRGGMGVVYQAEQTKMDRLVAIKVIGREVLAHPDALERFEREVKAAARLSHPNIVIAHDAEQVGDLHMLVMEYVEGQSLDQLLRRKGPLPLAPACHFARQAALGLQHAFEQGMVHRDIKPQNLMLTPKGQVKVLDFGLAKVVSENSTRQSLTASGAYMGTPEYCSPEQAADARQADIRADIYSLGCTLYALLAGKPPFQEGTAVLTIFAHMQKEPPPLPGVSPALWAVVARMLAKDPAQRQQTPAEVAQALAPFCKKREGQATAPARPIATAMPVGRPAASTRPVVASPFDDLTIEPARPAPHAKVPGPGSGGRHRMLLLAAVPGALAAVLGLVLLAALHHGPADTGRQARADATGPVAPVEAPCPSPLDCTGADGVSAAEVKRAQEAWAKYLGRDVEETVEIANGVRMTFVLVPPGTFRMGSPEDEKDRSTSETLHVVTLKEPFDLGKTEVTQAQYQALTGNNLSHFEGNDLPVEMVSWEGARDYAAQLTQKRSDKHLYSLPTEAQWEYACRGGRPSSKPFGVGDGHTLSSREAQFGGTSTRNVGSYPPNALGLLDMHGNVFEWCADWYEPYPPGEATDPTGPAEGLLRVFRGGRWNGNATGCRAAYRGRDAPGHRNYDLGFRLARSSPPGGK